MPRRIAMWAFAGAAVAAVWTLAVMLTGPWPASQHSVWTILRITYPVSLLGAFPLSFYVCVLVNAATYALVGLGFELVRRRPVQRVST